MRITITFILLFSGLILAMGSHGSAQTEDAGGEVLDPAAAEVQRFYDQRRAEIGEGDATGRDRLAVQLYHRYEQDGSNVHALELAQRELAAVVERDPEHRDARMMLDIVNEELAEAERRLHPDYWAMAFSVLGGLGIFLLGMKNISEGMQAVAGERLRRMIGAVTDNRLIATGVGAGVTGVIQSSSITTVIVVGLVNSGVMVLHQAIGVIMGANIGTTLTAWILGLDIGDYGLPILGAAAFAFLFSRSDRWRYSAMALLGIGMIFFGLELMKSGFAPMRGVPAFEEAFVWFRADDYFGVLKCAMVGCILTFIVQSSSATIGITIGLASTGVIPFETAAALVLGENIGTTITAWLASIGATTVAKRAAYAHVLFNLIGVAWITAIFPFYIQWVGDFIYATMGTNPLGAQLADFQRPDAYATLITAGIAATHTGFNATNTLIFLPFVRYFARFLEWLVPQRVPKEKGHLTRLDMRMVESPVIGIEQSRGEILKMGRGVSKMLAWTREIMNQDEPDRDLVRKVFHREQIMDNVQQEVIDFLTDLLTGNVPHTVSEEGRSQLRIADEYESVSDYISTLLKSHLRLVNAGLTITDRERAELMELHDMIAEYLELITTAVQHQQRDVLSRAHTRSEMITHHFKELRDHHLVRLTEEKVDPVASMSYTAMLNAYRKIKDHTLNVAEALVGEK